MGSELGSLAKGKQNLMVIRFTGPITKEQADKFNAGLDKALQGLGKTTKGRLQGEVVSSNAGQVRVGRATAASAVRSSQ